MRVMHIPMNSIVDGLVDAHSISYMYERPPGFT